MSVDAYKCMCMGPCALDTYEWGGGRPPPNESVPLISDANTK